MSLTQSIHSVKRCLKDLIAQNREPFPCPQYSSTSECEYEVATLSTTETVRPRHQLIIKYQSPYGEV
jgi:hypothetical protein